MFGISSAEFAVIVLIAVLVVYLEREARLVIGIMVGVLQYDCILKQQQG